METLMAIMSLVQLGTGIYQSIKGSQAGKEEMPTYTTPTEATEALTLAKNRAYGDMPGYGQAKSDIEQSAAGNYSRALESAASGSDVLGFLANQGVGTNRALNQLSGQNAAYQDQAKKDLYNALMQKAGYTDKEFQYNKYMPWQQAMDASGVLTEGGMQNIFGALSGFTTNYMGYKQNQQYMGILKDLYGNKTGAGTDNTGNVLSNMLLGNYETYRNNTSPSQQDIATMLLSPEGMGMNQQQMPINANQNWLDSNLGSFGLDYGNLFTK